MPDHTHLDWPFFDDQHRDHARQLAAWVKAHIAKEHAADEYAASTALVRQLAEGGWLKYCVPSTYGGALPLIDVRSLCLTRETLAYASGLADFAFAMQGLGSGPISLFGSEVQRETYLPPVARGEKIAAFALSEAEAGSDVSALQTTAAANDQGFLLNGSKTWISNAGIANFYIVFARTGEAPGAKGLSAFIVDADTPGFEVTSNIATISPHPLGSLSFADCQIPHNALIGRPGEGFKIAMATLDVFRSTVGAAALGFARRALDETLSHVRDRHVFGQPLASFQLTQGKLADMATDTDAAALLIYRSAWRKDTGAERVTREAAMAKSYATEAAQRVIDQAVQLFGGLGVTVGTTVEQLYRDIRPLRIYEGTTEIQKIIIANQLLKKE